MIGNWAFGTWWRWHSRGSSSTRARRDFSCRPNVEALEDRLTPSLGPQFAISTLAGAQHSAAATASSANGMSVAVWARTYSDTDRDIWARIYNPDGTPRGDPFEVSVSGDDELGPDVAMDGNGNFTVVWERNYQNGSTWSIYERSYTSQGGFRHEGWVTGINMSWDFTEPSVACDAAGNYVVSYTAKETGAPTQVEAARFGPAGNYLWGFTVAESQAGDSQSAVAMAANGKFAVAYLHGNNLKLKRYSAGGNLKGKHTLAKNVYPFRPDVGMDDKGNVVAAWTKVADGAFDVYARRVNYHGDVKSKIVVAGNPHVYEMMPSVAVDRSDGDFVVAYMANGVTVSEWSKKGKLKGFNTISGTEPDVSINGSGSFLVAFEMATGANSSGIFGRYGILS